MGRVVSFDEIQSLPKAEDFLLAKTELLGNLQKLVDSGELYGVQIFGSVAFDKPSLRSDLDVIIVYNSFSDTEELRRFLHKVQGIFTLIDQETHVPIQSIILDRLQVEAGRHDISDSLLDHLRLAPHEGNTVGQEIVPIVKPLERDRLETCTEYIAHKEYSMHSRATSPRAENQLEAVKDALEAPVNTGRKVLQVFDSESAERKIFSVDTGYDDSKASVVRNFMRLTDPARDSDLSLPQFSNMRTAFDYLVGKDGSYTRFLTETKQGLHSRGEYNAFVDRLRGDCVPRAIQWLSETGAYTSLSIRTQREGRIVREGTHRFQQERR